MGTPPRGGSPGGHPDDIHALWQRRIGRLVSRFGETAQRALELAAALGNEVDSTTWHRVCGDMPFLPRLQERLLELRLARETLHGWTFTHGMLRESLERTVRDAGLWEEHHLACAEAIRRIHGDQGREDYALHLLAGDRSLEAIAPLLEAAKRHCRLASFPRAMELCQTREDVLHKLDMDPGDSRYLEGYLLQARRTVSTAGPRPPGGAERRRASPSPRRADRSPHELRTRSQINP